jgi:hypothetical protein
MDIFKPEYAFGLIHKLKDNKNKKNRRRRRRRSGGYSYM